MWGKHGALWGVHWSRCKAWWGLLGQAWGFVWLLLVMVLGVGGLWAVRTACLQRQSSPTSCQADLDLLGSPAGCDLQVKPRAGSSNVKCLRPATVSVGFN